MTMRTRNYNNVDNEIVCCSRLSVSFFQISTKLLHLFIRVVERSSGKEFLANGNVCANLRSLFHYQSFS